MEHIVAVNNILNFLNLYDKQWPIYLKKLW